MPSREEIEQPIEGIVMQIEPKSGTRSQRDSVDSDPRVYAESNSVTANSPSRVDAEQPAEKAEDLEQAPSGKSHEAVDVEHLRQQLEGKNELIAALVSELEQVVEQLDRVKRSGANRSSGGPAMVALPTNTLEEQQQIFGGLQRVVEEWEELRAGVTLSRIESELAELRKLVATGVVHRQEPEDRMPAGNSLDEVLSRLSIGRNAHSGDDSQSVGLGSEVSQTESPEETVDAATAGNEVDEVANLLDGIALPGPVDPETATLDDLKRACADRDTCIVQITRCLRARRAVALPNNWEELSGVPDELRRHVDTLASRLEEQVRLAEVEISLERARLSRERSELETEMSVFEKHLKRLGVTSANELENISVSSSSSTDRRWMRFLGVNR